MSERERERDAGCGNFPEQCANVYLKVKSFF